MSRLWQASSKHSCKGIGPHAIRCSTCDTETAPFKMTNGYTMALDHKGQMGVTVVGEGARQLHLMLKTT